MFHSKHSKHGSVSAYILFPLPSKFRLELPLTLITSRTYRLDMPYLCLSPPHIHPAYAFQNVLMNKLSHHSFIKTLLIFSTTYEIKPTLWLS